MLTLLIRAIRQTITWNNYLTRWENVKL